MKIKNVIDGWYNTIIEDAAIEEMAVNRYKVCSDCPSKIINILNLEACGECHCPLVAKTRSPNEKCPFGKW